MTDLRSRLIKNSTIDYTATLTDSKIYGKKDMIPTRVPLINAALSGRIDGGLTPGLTVLAAPSKHFKTAFSLLLAAAYIKANPDGIILFYDSEFGTPESYFTSFGVPLESVVHTPITDIEQLKFDIMHQMQEIKRGDKVMIIIDSVGNLASKKEVEDALKQSSAADMTRAKQLKSLFRMVTPHLSLKDIPMVVVNHIYMTQEMYAKPIVSGGTGIYYSADNIWIIGRQQDKDDKELLGYHFVINIEKSRYVKEKSKLPITVNFDSGINVWSGLLDLALEGQFITKPKQGWYARVDRDTGEIMGKNYRAADIVDNGDFWKAIFEETNFADWIKNKYSLGAGEMIREASGDEDEE
jgi:RecA/RadA recombinase